MSAIDPDLDVAALRVLAASPQAERDVARAGERTAMTMARDAAVEKVAALERYRLEVVEHVRASAATVTGIVRRLEAEVARLKAPRPDRESLGRLVREVWIEWAREQPAPKASWLVPWEGLPEPDREVDRRIGERLAAVGARPVLTEAQARGMVEKTWIDGVDDSVDQTIDRFTALLMRVAGPETTEQASMAAAFDAVAEHAGALPDDYADRRAQGETGHGMATPVKP